MEEQRPAARSPKQPLLTLTVHNCKTRSTTVKDKWGKDWLHKNGDTTSNDIENRLKEQFDQQSSAPPSKAMISPLHKHGLRRPMRNRWR